MSRGWRTFAVALVVLALLGAACGSSSLGSVTADGAPDDVRADQDVRAVYFG